MSTEVIDKQDEAASKNKRVHERKALHKKGYAIYDRHPQVDINTFDISVNGVGFTSPIKPDLQSNCWVRLKVPVSPERDQVFDVKAVVKYCIYSNYRNGFNVGVQFLNATPELEALIKKLK